MWIWIVLIIAILLFLYFFVYKKYVSLPLNHLSLVNGGLGSGKTTFAVAKAISQHKKAIRSWWICKTLFFWSKNKVFDTPPRLYSSQPLNYPYVPLTSDILLGKKVPVPKSIVLWTEASLGADSMSYNSSQQKAFVQFIKLYRHISLGGYMFIDTQAIKDLNYAIKRSCNSYIWIEKFRKLPFLLWYKVRVMLYQDETTLNINSSNPSDDTRNVLILKHVWKKFYTYNYHGLYKNVPIDLTPPKVAVDLESYFYPTIEGDKK